MEILNQIFLNWSAIFPVALIYTIGASFFLLVLVFIFIDNFL